jgi:hypothetical protein
MVLVIAIHPSDIEKGMVGFGYDEYFDLLYPTSPLN